MKVAVACDSPTTVACHMGRAPMFLVYDVVDGKPVLCAERQNDQAGHSEQCSDAPGAPRIHHDHKTLVDAVADCQIVVGRGMGGRLAADFEARGIRAAVIDADVAPLEAAGLAIEGKRLRPGGFCSCSHSH